jgi:peroxidase
MAFFVPLLVVWLGLVSGSLSVNYFKCLIFHINQCNKTFIVNWQDDANASNRQANSLPAAPTCDPLYKYRSFDGTCNNLNNPRFGQAGTNFQRLMGPANYADGTESNFSLL